MLHSIRRVHTQWRLGKVSLVVLLIIFLSLGVLIFGSLSVVAFTNAQQAVSSLRAETDKSYQKGRQDQEGEDRVKAQKEAEVPYRTYTAPQAYGKFSLKFPKNWNVYALENGSATIQLSLLINPDVVRSVTGAENLYAARVNLSRELYSAALKRYDEYIKKGVVVSSTVSVSSISSTRLQGKLNGKTESVMVLVPVRDKVLTFANEDKNFIEQFNQIVAQASITP